MVNFGKYLKEIERKYATGIAGEHAHRAALQELIETVGKDTLGHRIDAVNDPKRIECGAPDFIVTKGQTPLGYIEAKDIETRLDAEEDSEQMIRYLNGLSNLILTDYLEFRWYVGGERRLIARLAAVDAKGKLKVEIDGPAKVSEALSAFLRTEVPTVRSAKELAVRMAGLARLIRGAIRKTLDGRDGGTGLRDQLAGFRKILIEDLTQDQFADMYAQTICYGLFAARCNHADDERFTREKAAFELPETNPFLREIFSFVAGPDLDSRVTWVVDDLAELLDHAKIAAILKDFGKRTRREDPVVHFYETFLAEYDPEVREMRGIYYTPEPVVSYIVLSVDHILKTDFGLADGLADISMVDMPKRPEGGRKKIPKVFILDPAVGTGTFLYSVIARIHERLIATGQEGAWSTYVSTYLLPRLFGFELLMAPYAVCHMKLGLQLADTGYDFKANERLHVYLTNTLEEAHKLVDVVPFARELAREATEAAQVKEDKPVMVILGNPPYSGHSANKGPWITKLLRGHDTITGKETDSYFMVDGRPLGERNPKWLNDDYVKFIRFAQWRIERTGYGILAFVSNHGYLDNPTFRGMRQSLMETFDDIYVLDLHGSAKKKEKAPDGSRDENVFDIQQGVAIGIFVKRQDGRKKHTKVRHADLWGVREVPEDPLKGKYGWLNSNDVATTKWKRIAPQPDTYGFTPHTKSMPPDYRDAWKVSEIFPRQSLGVATARDRFAVQFTADEITEIATEFLSLSVEEARDRFGLGKDVEDWTVEGAQNDLRQNEELIAKPIKILYRPFDIRFTIYTGKSRGFMCRPRRDVMQHVQKRDNRCLSTTRSIEIGRGWEHVFCSKYITQLHTVSLKEVNYLAPLYVYSGSLSAPAATLGGRRPNLSPQFIEDFGAKLDLEWVTDGKGDRANTFGPEDIFSYIYAVLHAPSYRSRYADFLKSDFPRIPITSNAGLFHTLSSLGDELVGLHLMERHEPTMTGYPAAGDDTVGKVRYTMPSRSKAGRVWINETQYFEGVPPKIWEFHIGGYQVCQKWLKDRKGRALSFDDITHYQRIVAALAETVRITAEIDEAIEAHSGWPIQ